MAHIEKAVENAVKGAMEKVEQRVDEEIDRLNNLEDDELEEIRKKRLAQMKKAAEDRAIWKRNGHGTVQQIAERDFFTRAKGTQRVVAIFHRPGTSRFAQDLLDHMTRVAERHLETLFVTIEAEKAPFLCETFKIRILPSLVFAKDSEIDRVLIGLDQISTSGKFTTTGPSWNRAHMIKHASHRKAFVKEFCIRMEAVKSKFYVEIRRMISYGS